MIKEAFDRKDWDELTHEERGHVFPTYFYWRSVQLAAKVVKCPPGIFGIWYKDDGFSWMTTKGALANTGKKILEKLESDKNFLKKIVDTNLTLIPKMLKDSEWFAQDLTNKSGKELLYQLSLVNKDFLDLMTYSALATVMEFEEPVLSDKLLRILVDKVGKEKGGEYFSELTLITDLTVAQKEQLELKHIKAEDLESHWKEYAWLPYNYDGPGWTFEEMKERFKHRAENKEADMNDRINYQRKMEKELKLSEHEKFLFKILRTLGFWKFERKLLNTKSHYWVENLFKEIARRNNITLEDAKSILPSEMKNALVNEKIDKELLRERRKLSVAIYRGYDDFEVYTGEEALRLEKNIEESLKVDTTITEIKGATAYKGYAKGRVQIVNNIKDMEGFKEGDILVSASTSPDIITSMKKAAAIITDSGGITCHAAIVARELKVPTVIGTKIATKILKNNDMVEVDANKGVVKRIK